MTIDDRLHAVADLVRQGARFADIGTDHAYLPVFLTESGRIAEAYASDIAEGPLKTAYEHVAEHGLLDRITLRLADGLAGLFDTFPGVTDIAVCGMGGELIARLLSEEPRVKNKDIRLLLQPMSRPQALRNYLAENGFAIITETLAKAQGRIYSILSAEYTGVPYELSPLESTLGGYYVTNDGGKLFLPYVTEYRDTLRAKIAGMRIGNCDTKKEDELLAAYEKLLSEREKYDG